MPRVICNLPNASDEISGVKFHQLDDGRMISDEISDEQANRFASISGYELDEEGIEVAKPVEPAPAPKQTKAQQAKAAKAAEAKAAEAVEEQPAQAAEAEAANAEEVF